VPIERPAHVGAGRVAAEGACRVDPGIAVAVLTRGAQGGAA
jgi:hypothetical protein